MERHAEEFIISEAKKMMLKYPSLKMFCIAMGGWSFYDEKGPTNDDRKFIAESPLYKFLEEWDRTLGLSALGIKITQSGEVIRNW
jgi:hypothetical protein